MDEKILRISLFGIVKAFCVEYSLKHCWCLFSCFSNTSLVIHLSFSWYNMHVRVTSSYPIRRSPVWYTFVGVIFSALLGFSLLLWYGVIVLVIWILAWGYIIMNIIRWSSLLFVVHDEWVAIDHHHIPYHRIDRYRPITYSSSSWKDTDYTITWLVISVDGIPHTFTFVDHSHIKHIIMSLDAQVQRSDSYDDTRYDELLRGSKI